MGLLRRENELHGTVRPPIVRETLANKVGIRVALFFDPVDGRFCRRNISLPRGLSADFLI